jgi:ubiquinol-cytochrome c reductase cytochrome b subunit
MSFPWANEYKPSNPFMQWMDEKLPLPRFVYNAVGAGYPVPRNLNYMWNFGVPGRLLPGAADRHRHRLAMHYAANAGVAFDSVEHIMRDVNWGWLMRYAHANGASAFFVVVYIHIFRGFFTARTRPRAK